MDIYKKQKHNPTSYICDKYIGVKDAFKYWKLPRCQVP